MNRLARFDCGKIVMPGLMRSSCSDGIVTAIIGVTIAYAFIDTRDDVTGKFTPFRNPLLPVLIYATLPIGNFPTIFQQGCLFKLSTRNTFTAYHAVASEQVVIGQA